MTEEWSPARRVAFRFVLAYLILYNMTAIEMVPGLGLIAAACEGLWNTVVPWVGQVVLGLDRPIDSLSNGSGDRTFDYVQVLVMLVAAILATALWSVLDRRRPSHPRLAAGLRVLVRYVLAFTMVSYGLAKVFKNQFPYPPPGRLLEPYGDSSPMRLLWTFMGYSTAYTFFAGLGEVTGGLLLLSRRTTSLGALIVAGVLSNVVMLNFSYDVPVKLYSVHLLLMALFLLVPDARRLANVFILNRPASAAPTRKPHSLRWVERTRLGVKIAIISVLLFGMVSEAIHEFHQFGDGAPRPAPYGIYEVEAFASNGEARAPLLTDATRWRRLVFGRGGYASIQAMDESDKWFRVTDDPSTHTVTLISEDDKDLKVVLTYGQPDTNRLAFEGMFLGDALNVRLKRRDESSFLLVNRGFHWVNERPFNR